MRTLIFLPFILVASLALAVDLPAGRETSLGEASRAEKCRECHQRVADSTALGEKQPLAAHPGRFQAGHPPERFGCVLCHGGNGKAVQSKEAHADVRYTVRPFNLLDDPQTHIRHFLRGAEAQGSCFKCHENVWDEISEVPLLSQGAHLFLNRCSGCHNVSRLVRPVRPPQKRPSRTEKAEEEEGFPDRQLKSWRKLAPPLTRLRRKVSRDWALQFLKDPRSIQPATRMPNFLLQEEEVKAIVSYLFSLEGPEIPRVEWDPVLLKPEAELEGEDRDRWVRIFRQGEQLWEEARCPICHASRGRGALVKFDLAPSLESVADKVNRDWLYFWLNDPPAYNPHTYMPRFRFTDADLKSLVHYMMSSPHFTAGGRKGTSSRAESSSPSIVEKGRELVAYYGCSGCHEIRGHEREPKIGVTLSDFGAKPLEQLNFGQQDLPRDRRAWIARKLLDPRFTAKTTLRKPRMPQIGLGPEQVEALTVLLMNLTGDEIPQPLKPKRHAIGQPLPPTLENLAKGRGLFLKYCTACHGQEGRGDGAGWFESFPRDLTTGLYRSRSAMVGYLPIERDLFRTLTRGMPGSAMPPFAFLPERERWQLVRYVKSLIKEKGVLSEPPEEIAISEELPVTPESLARGKELFEGLRCYLCHGRDGKGLKREEGKFEDWVDKAGRPIPRSADLTRGIFKSGSSARDIYRILTTGMADSPMPPFAFSIFSEEDWWALVHYVQSLFRKDLLEE